MDQELILNDGKNGQVGLSNPKLVVIRLLKRCNAQCQMCDFWKTKDSGYEWTILKRLLDESKALGCQNVCFSGGEPTAYAHFFEATSYVRSLGIHYSFISNGSMLTSSFIEKLMSSPPEKIYLSVDSPTASIHDEERGFNGLWKRAFLGMHYLNELSSRPKIIVNFVVSKRNFRDLPEMVKKSEGRIFDEINLIPIRGMPSWMLSFEEINEFNQEIVPRFMRALNDYHVTLRNGFPFIFGKTRTELENSLAGECSRNFYKHTPCRISHSMMYIDDKGDVFPCNNTPYCGETFKLGNIHVQSLESIWNSNRAEQVRKLTGTPQFCGRCDPVNQYINLLAFKRKKVERSDLVEVSH